MHNKKGLTLLEIITATIILSLIMIGMANVFLASKRYILHSRSRMTGGELGKYFLDPLQMQVRQDTWGGANNALRTTGVGSFRYCNSVAGDPQQPPGFCPSQAERTLNNIEYAAQYEINPHPQAANIRRVVTTISWNEPAP